MKKYIIMLLTVYSINAFSQKQDSIIYIFPDKVEQMLFAKMSDIPNFENLNFEFYLESIDKDKFRTVFAYSQNKLDSYWGNNTNRFILIKDKKYPLLLDYDSTFSTKKPGDIGNYGQREGTILKTIFIYEGYSITFDKTGQFIKEDFGIDN